LASLVWCLVLSQATSLSLSCKGEGDSPNVNRATSPPSSPAANTTIMMSNLDGKNPIDGLEVGRQALVDLVTDREDVRVCALVHPLQTDTWWVQSLPSLPNKGTGGWQWRLISLFGTEMLGRREKYEIMAIAEQTQNICVAGRTLKVDQAQTLLGKHPRSRVVTVNRVRD
jgi:hypothetical protein